MKNFQGLQKCAQGAVVNTEDFMSSNNSGTSIYARYITDNFAPEFLLNSGLPSGYMLSYVTSTPENLTRPYDSFQKRIVAFNRQGEMSCYTATPTINFAFDELINLENILEDDILTNRQDVPEIWYTDKTRKIRRNSKYIRRQSSNEENEKVLFESLAVPAVVVALTLIFVHRAK
jgi:hypothetical protein